MAHESFISDSEIVKVELDNTKYNIVMINSAITEEIAAPKLAYFGINIRFNKKLIIAPPHKAPAL